MVRFQILLGWFFLHKLKDKPYFSQLDVVLGDIVMLKNILHFILSCPADDPGYFCRDICYTALQVTHEHLCVYQDVTNEIALTATYKHIFFA